MDYSQGQSLVWTVGEAEDGQRLDRALAAWMPEFSRTRIQRWIDMGAVRLDGRLVLPKTPLKMAQTLEVWPQPSDAQQAFKPEDLPIDVEYEDDSVLCVCKPAGLVTHPGHGNWTGTLMNGLLHFRPLLARLPRAGIVHRLDKDTSGLMVVAKTEPAMMHLVDQLARREVKRHYLALVYGHCADSFMIDAAMGRDPKDPLRMAIRSDEHAKPAITHVRCLSKSSIAFPQPKGLRQTPWPSKAASADFCAVECRLETGRTHQIRVHLSSQGHALLGDPVYQPLRGQAGYAWPRLEEQDSDKALQAVRGFSRQALHARRLGFIHPVSGEALQFERDLPQDMAQLASVLRLTTH
jgi:23S rRNA pseudouridine1911/1915/1917 synthase